MTLPYVGRNQGQSPQTYLPFYLGDWQIVTQNERCELQRTFDLHDHASARQFAAQIMQIASDEGHFPVLYIYKSWVCVIWLAYHATGLTADDYIMAQRTDETYAAFCSD